MYVGDLYIGSLTSEKSKLLKGKVGENQRRISLRMKYRRYQTIK